MDIIIYTTPETLEHKKGGDGCQYHYWYLSKSPKDFRAGEKIYFATNKHIRGYFVCNGIDHDSDNAMSCDLDTWVDIDPIPCIPFQGFKYKRS